MSEYPKSYIIGQEYINDEQTEVTFKFFVRLPCVFSNVSLEDKKIKLYMLGEFLVIQYTLLLSKKLFEDISSGKRYNYVWSYLDKILPYVNSEIQKNKYSRGQVLLRNLSFFDIAIAQVYKNNTCVAILESSIFDNFPKLCADNTFHNFVYIRDYIDAITAILYYDYEEFIKKSITSIENYFIQHEIEKDEFKKTLRRILKPTDNMYGNKTIYKNICYIYKLRNKIVHNTLRIDYNKKEWKYLCNVSLATLQYLFQRVCSDKAESKYIFDVYMQYSLIKVNTDTTLCDIIESKELSCDNNNQDKTIDEIMYDSLIIPEDVKKAIES